MFELTLKLAQGNLPPQLFRVRGRSANLRSRMALHLGFFFSD